MKNDQKRFISLIAVVAILVSGGSLYFYTQNKKISENENNIVTKIESNENVKTYSSANQYEQFDNIEFDYPDNWQVYPQDDSRTSLSKEKNIPKDKFYDEVIVKGKTYIDIRMSEDSYTKESIAKKFLGKNIEDKKIGDKQVIIFLMKKSPDSSKDALVYTFSTPYINKKNITFLLYSEQPRPPAEDIVILEKIISSFKVIETERGTIELNRQKSHSKSVQEWQKKIEENPKIAENAAKDGFIKSVIQSLRDKSLKYYQSHNDSFNGLCSSSDIENTLTNINKYGSSRCLSYTDSYVVTAKLSDDSYACIDSNTVNTFYNNEYNYTETRSIIIDSDSNQKLFNKNPLACK